MRSRSIFILLACLLSTGCTEIFLTKPDLTLTKQPDIALAAPIALAVIDDEAATRGGAYAAQLAKAITDAYPHAIELRAATADDASGRVAVTIRIHHLGAFFNRTVYSVLNAGPETTELRGTVADWDAVAAAAFRTGPVSQGTVFKDIQGNWSGIADLDIVLVDQRPGRAANFTVPLAYEHSQPNVLGYIGAMMLADDAWRTVAPRLAAFLDAAVRKVKAEEPGAGAASSARCGLTRQDRMFTLCAAGE